MERQKFTKSEKQYLRGIIHNLSLSRWTAQEIADYLRDEKKIEISRSTVTKTMNQIEQSAENWYIELRNSRYKYIATYKERLDSLLSHQKKLNDIVTTTKTS
ncbi:MAG: helix-turn-helix domain-containing protein [Thermoproteota archaeon]|nr:helix-turn-helix domain-containing protein [Thermoproteota archaeon]